MSSAADLVGADIMSGDPDGVSQLARRMSNLAQDVSAMREKFSAQYLGGVWTGPAFEAFARTLEDVPKDLAKVSTSYAMAADALAAYRTALDDVQRTARVLAAQATDAETRANSADGDRTRARRALQAAKSARAGAADPVAQHDAQRRVQLAASMVAGADQRHLQAVDDLGTAHSRADGAVAAFRAAVRLCCHRLADASAAGIQNTPLSWYNRHVADTPFGVIIGAVTAPLAAIAALPGDVMALAKNIGDLAAWRGVLDFVGTAILVATVLVLIAGTGGVALVALGIASVVVAGAEFGVDSARVGRGEISGDALVWDGLAVVTAAIPGGRYAAKFAPVVPKALRTESASWATRYLRYGPSGRHMAIPERINELKSLGHDTLLPDLGRQVTRRIVPSPALQPCVAPLSGLGASPVGAIRHSRGITPRPIAFAHAS